MATPAPTDLQLEFYGRVPFKVHAVDLHPSRPWMCTVDERGGVAVWDLRVNIVLSRWNLGVMLDDDHIVGPKVGKLGQVLCGKFVDVETAVAASAQADDHSVAPVGRWICVGFANHVVLLEWRAGQLLHYRTAVLTEGRPNSAVTFVPATGVIALGGTDGIVRVVDWRRGTVRARLQGPHTKSITALAASGVQLLSGAADGTLAVWDTRRDIAVASSGRAHTDRVSALAAGRASALSVAVDRGVVLWALDTGRERVRARVNIGKPWAAAALADGTFAVVAKESGVHRVGLQGETGPLLEYSALMALPKAAKSYSLAGHVSAPRVACGTNVGVMVVSVAPRRGCAIGRSPGAGLVFVAGGKALVQQRLSDGEKSVVATLPLDGVCEVDATPTASAVSVFWPGARRALVLAPASGSFGAVYDGECGGVAWAAAGTRVAMIRSNGSTVQVSDVQGSLNPVASITPGGAVTAVFGGALLGVVTAGHMQLYSWQGEAIGSPLPAPRALAYDAAGTLLALAYSHRLVICSLRPFAVVCNAPIANAQALLWYCGAVYAAGEHGAWVVLPAPGHALTAVLAATGAEAGGDFTAHDAAVLCVPASLPGGTWAPAAVHKGALLVVDVRGTVQSVPLRSSALRAALLCAAGRAGEAQPLLAGLRPEVVALIAQYVAASSTSALQAPPLDMFRLPLRDRIVALLSAQRYAEAARLLPDVSGEQAAPLCRAVAVAAAAAGEESVALGALDRLNALYGQC